MLWALMMKKKKKKVPIKTIKHNYILGITDDSITEGDKTVT
jgi:hypothetical protein